MDLLLISLSCQASVSPEHIQKSKLAADDSFQNEKLYFCFIQFFSHENEESCRQDNGKGIKSKSDVFQRLRHLIQIAWNLKFTDNLQH